jgi:hypothetical protein
MANTVIPVKTGIQNFPRESGDLMPLDSHLRGNVSWIPACAGMTLPKGRM